MRFASTPPIVPHRTRRGPRPFDPRKLGRVAAHSAQPICFAALDDDPLRECTGCLQRLSSGSAAMRWRGIPGQYLVTRGSARDDGGERRETMADVTSFLEQAGVDFDVLDHPRTERATDEAGALGVDPGQVAKTLVVRVPSGNVRAVVAASERIDLHKVAAVLDVGGKKVQLASEDDLARDYADFELGAVPPFGGRADPVIVDERLAALDSVVLEAGSHDRSVRLKSADLVRLTNAQVADITREEPTGG